MYFPESYNLDSCRNGDTNYYETIDQAVKDIEEIVGHTVIATVEDIQETLDEYVESQDDDVLFYSFYEFTVTE